MLESGGEISRVENTIMRICDAYGFSRVDVFSVTSFIVAGIKTSNGNTFTQTRRIYTYSTNLHRLEMLNNLSRKICKTTPSCEDIEKDINSIMSSVPRNSLLALTGFLLSTFALCINRGGSVIDGLVSTFIGVFLFLADKFLTLKSVNRIAYTILCSTFAGTLALLLAHFGIGEHADKIMIGNVMLLIPGIPLINSAREILCGDIMAGILRLTEAVIVAVSIACGFALPLVIFGGYA